MFEDIKGVRLFALLITSLSNGNLTCAWWACRELEKHMHKCVSATVHYEDAWHSVFVTWGGKQVKVLHLLGFKVLKWKEIQESIWSKPLSDGWGNLRPRVMNELCKVWDPLQGSLMSIHLLNSYYTPNALRSVNLWRNLHMKPCRCIIHSPCSSGTDDQVG
jgi:hypothetical protein